MKSFDGDIFCESEIGKFTSFILKFPKVEGAESIKIEQKSCDGLISLKNKLILLVDDQDLNRMLISRQLEKHQAIIHQAKNGKEAIEKLNQNQNYDIILMDIEMPIMNGLEAVEIIRKEFQNQIPIIAITGDDNEKRKEEIAEAGFDDYFVKGDDYENLIVLVINNCNNHF